MTNLNEKLSEHKFRTSITVPADVMLASQDLISSKRFRSFSDLVEKALVLYANQHHPNLVVEKAEEIKESPSLVTDHKLYKKDNPTGRKLDKSKPAKKIGSRAIVGTKKNADRKDRTGT